MDENTDSLRKLLRASTRITVFTGAGISTESGIPDFRSPNGIWSKMKPIEFEDFVSSEEIRKEAWRRKIIIDNDMKDAAPNLGHRAVAALVRSGKCRTVITQNIDGLHQISGIAAEQIVELHGNGTYATCLSCNVKYDLKPILDAFSRNEQLPVCSQCGGIIKTATISFGQSMPVKEMERAKLAALNCDLFLVLGSSLVVYPAAAFPGLAKRNGAALVIINRDPTDQDPVADLVLHREIGETLSSALGVC
ncbi:MAG: Sir2 family NAD-dependent protein deacetylase [Proteobacteria bacterium]|nr:Sir2 family NAD-dependent protein deacetylase [Pseudomonadota bacterium]